MRQGVQARTGVVAILLAAGTATALAGPPLGASTDPLRLASLPLDVADLEAATARWSYQVGLTYFNLWQHSWHVPALHLEQGRSGLPVADAELVELARRYPEADVYFADLEGWRADLRVTRDLGHGVALSAQLPFLQTGHPRWDAIAEDWHAALSLPEGNRDRFPRGGALLFANGEEPVIRRRELLASGPGDASLALSLPVPLGVGGAARAALVVQAPTGDRGSLAGSGGWDTGLRLGQRWEWRRTSLAAAAGYTWLDGGGRLLGLRRSDTWHLQVGVEQRLAPRLTARGAVVLESSPLAAATATALGEPAAALTLGLALRMLGASVALDLGQDWYGQGVSPDYSFRLSVGGTLGTGP